MNRPSRSKINWTAGAIALANIGFLLFEVPREYHIHITALIGVLMPALIIVFRTWFTEKKNAQ